MSLQDLSKREKIEILVGVLASMLLAALDQTIVGTALPSIVKDLNGYTLLTWVVSAYLLAAAVAVPISSKLSDIFGRKNLYLVNISIFLLGSILCGQAQSMGELIAFRALQGIGGGFLLASAFTVIGDIFPPRERGRWQGLFGAVFGFASVVGPTLGGYLTDHFSWRWVFYINVPVAIVAIILLVTGMPNFKHERRPIDWLGALTLIWAVVPLMLALTWGGSKYAWGSSMELAMFSVAAVGLAAFLINERRAADAIVPLRFFENRNFSLSNAIIFLSAAGLFGGVIYIPIFVQTVIGKSATSSGLILLPMMAAVVVSSVITGQITSRTGRTKWLGVGGLAILTFATLLLSHISIDTSNAAIIRDMVLMGLGMGVTFPLFTLIIQNEFTSRDLGAVTGALTFFRTVGGAVGTAVLGTVFNNTLRHHLDALSLPSQLPSAASQALHNPNILSDPNRTKAVVDAVNTHVPAQFIATFQNAINVYLRGAKEAIAFSIGHVFVAGVAIAGSCFVLMLFMIDRPLRETNDVPKGELVAGEVVL
jgi:EmrB/QacA subfamily drug resistance transporter